jgi:hypothetical protein
MAIHDNYVFVLIICYLRTLSTEGTSSIYSKGKIVPSVIKKNIILTFVHVVHFNIKSSIPVAGFQVPDVAVAIAAVAAAAGAIVVANFVEVVDAAVAASAGTKVVADCKGVVNAADADVASGEVSITALEDVVHFTVAFD